MLNALEGLELFIAQVNPQWDTQKLSIVNYGLVSQARTALEKEKRIPAMFALFDSVLRRERHTAWVALTDQIGIMAMDFLKSQGAAGRLSVVAFDDTIEALGAGLSSYHFGTREVVRAMLEHILYHKHPRRAPSAPLIEVPGVVMMRRSLGKAAGAC